jgi:KUP system potassium uptake protein
MSDKDRPHAPAGSFGALAVGALGVVFGDIGTSPLYTLQVGIMPEGSTGPPPAADVLGVCSLIFWALTLVVTVKYLGFVMRADNHGEGGILALLALVPRDRAAKAVRIGGIAVLVVAGAALLYGDGIITPAISVLSALEGLELAAPGIKPAIVPATCVVLLGLFAIQRRGTGGIGKIFGPVMIAWFVCIAALGAWHVVRNPSILVAISPTWGAGYFVRHGWHGFAILGVVVLAVTGGEALYADMGHFGARPIRASWLVLVFPALVLCYLGQGALVLRDSSALANPFFAMVPDGGATYALVVLAAAATVIASQSLISGVFSLTHQAVQLGYFPRVKVTHTSGEAEGQIYVPSMNWGLCALCITLVLAFKESARLASAYGIAVSGTMGITSIAYFVVTRRTWRWPLWKSTLPVALFLSFDLPFFAANLLKFWDGGWVPILVGAAMFVVMIDWRFGRAVLAERIEENSPPLAKFMEELDEQCVARIPGAAIFLSSNPEGTPHVLYNLLRRIRTLREANLLLTVTTEHVPVVGENDRFTVDDLGKGMWRVVVRTGFIEQPNVPEFLAQAKQRFSIPVDLEDATYVLGRETFVAGRGGKMGVAAESLFAFLTRNARSAPSWFQIPPEKVIELGIQMDL